MEESIIKEVSEQLGISQEALLERGLIAYLERELRLAEQDIANLRDRYGVLSPEELEGLINSGRIYSHPAWEDLIIWENTLHHVGSVKKLLERIYQEHQN